ncbi:glycosyltransferase [Streptomyces sp. V3I8]|uniref:glycosyltransferase n=1 Tax=Streptomyces sp. V3I8 TaxID=3042279 RepID=UPI0027D8342F|nr:glycosyltransferase [Streptomyces sp. V3I8]
MRILFTTWAWPSHLYAMVPLAWACRASGHDVLVASQPRLTDLTLRTGLNAAPVGHDVDAVAVFREIAGTAGGTRASGTGRGPRVLGLFTSLAEAMVDDLTELTARWHADAIVFEPTTFAGPLAAAASGIPAVRHLYGTDLLGAAGDLLSEALAPLCRRAGVSGVNPFGVATLDPCPGALQGATGSPRLPMGSVPYNGPGVLPALPPRSQSPRVCVTWGHTMGRLDPGYDLTGEIVRTIADLDVEPVAAVSARQRDTLGRVPRDVRVMVDTPLHLLLPECDLMIAHGGAGSLLTALRYDLPQLLLPRLPDHIRHAGRLAETGAAAVIPATEWTRESVRERLGEMLRAHRYRQAAQRLGREMREQPSPAQLVRHLEILVTRDDTAP